MMDRRTFLATGAALAAGAACATGSGAPGGRIGKRLSLLVLGGTGYLGPDVVEVARAHGHKITLFNRGKTNPGLFPDLEHLVGDRDGNLKALEGRSWDAVIDPSGYVPRIVRASLDLLAPHVGYYLFVSTISVYDDTAHAPITESAPLAKLPPEYARSEDRQRFYGALKVLCEQEVATVMPGRSMSVRPGLIVGPDDPTDRFTYWPVHIDQGGEVLAPGDGNDPVQFIDSRDLARWMLRAVETRLTGTFNAVGPAQPLKIRDFLTACQKACARPAELVWVDTPFLEQKNVSPWSDMPTWIPAGLDFTQVSSAPAIAAGLTFRPLEETIRDTLAWWKAQPAERTAKLRAGISPEREKEVLAAWRASGGKGA